MTFKELEIIKPILDAIVKEGYEVPTPIQIQAIPVLLSGRDVLGSAQTGTGKTAAFAIPILQKLMEVESRKGVKALILTPTRELAMQVKNSFDIYGKYLPIKTAVIFGGVSQKPQVQKIKQGADILIATPGRLLDLMNQKKVRLDTVEFLVLDEADRMLDMGFIDDVKKIISNSSTNRQTMLFSATLPKSIIKLAEDILIEPETVEIKHKEVTVDVIDQKLYFSTQSNKINLLFDLLKNNEYYSVLLFTRTKASADTVVKNLNANNIKAIAIHSNKSQIAREKALKQFKSNKYRVLVATDIASRGLDIEDLSCVINYDLPEEAETYVHRIGRTGRANKSGYAISMCQKAELHLLSRIQKHIKFQIPVISDHNFAESYSAQDFGSSGSRNRRSRSKNSFSSNNSGKSENYKKYSQENKKAKRNSSYTQASQPANLDDNFYKNYNTKSTKTKNKKDDRAYKSFSYKKANISEENTTRFKSKNSSSKTSRPSNGKSSRIDNYYENKRKYSEKRTNNSYV